MNAKKKTTNAKNPVVRIKLNPEHSLGDYHAKDPAATRRKALRLAVEERGYTKVIRRLNVLYIYNKIRHKKRAAIFRADMKYVQRLRDAAQQSLKKKRDYMRRR